jgi:hypothetical protein
MIGRGTNSFGDAPQCDCPTVVHALTCAVARRDTFTAECDHEEAGLNNRQWHEIVMRPHGASLLTLRRAAIFANPPQRSGFQFHAARNH